MPSRTGSCVARSEPSSYPDRTLPSEPEGVRTHEVLYTRMDDLARKLVIARADGIAIRTS